MPKMKTKKAAAKRFKITGSGKILRRKPNLRHNLEGRPHKTKKKNGKAALVHASDLYRIERALNYGNY